MCGRFSLTLALAKLRQAFPNVEFVEELIPHYNIAPTQPIAVVPNIQPLKMEYYRWGLIPSWAKDPGIGVRLINARAETLREKPAFRSAYGSRRCLVLADGFFEWVSIEGKKTKLPIYFRMKSGTPFALAGLWEVWKANDENEIRSATIITTEANEMVGQFHERMPVILPQDKYSIWLDPERKSGDTFQGLLKPYPAEEMTCYPVSTLANSAVNDSPDVILP